MRQDFRVKLDLSRLYQDYRAHSWVYIDSLKITHVHQLAEHVQRLFDIAAAFHLRSRCDDVFYYLPFEEDVRILQDNDTVFVIPGAVATKKCSDSNFEECMQNLDFDFAKPYKSRMDESNAESRDCSYVLQKSSYIADQSSLNDRTNDLPEKATTFSNTLYKTAMHDTLLHPSSSDTSKLPNNNDSIADETATASDIADTAEAHNSRKRTRKRRTKKSSADKHLPESDISLVEQSQSTRKKPKILDSVVISSGKHIRFENVDEEEVEVDGAAAAAATSATAREQGRVPASNGDAMDKRNGVVVKGGLENLLSMRQSSTPLTFARRIGGKREFKQETISERESSKDGSFLANGNGAAAKVTTNGYGEEKKKEEKKEEIKEKEKDDNKAGVEGADETVSFKVFRISENYTPALSNVILAKVLSIDEEKLKYTMKILHGQEQLELPEGKFSMPKDDEEMEQEQTDIVVLDKSQLLDLTKVTAIGNST